MVSFHMFPRLPSEVQREIFKYLLPPTRVYHVKFSFSDSNDDTQPHLLPEGLPHTTLSVFIHRFKPAEHEALLKVELTSVGRTKIRKKEEYVYAEVWSEPNIVLNHNRGDDARMYMHLRPEEDIIMINAEDLLIFYHYGGSIDMSKITSLGLYDTPWQNSPYDRNFHMSFPEHEILNHLRKYCPALKKLYISFPGICDWSPGGYANRLLLYNPELPGRFEHLDYVNRDGKDIGGLGDDYFRRTHDAHILQARMISDALAKHLSHPEREEWLDESTREELTVKKKFWEKVEIIPSSVRCMPSRSTWKGYAWKDRRLVVGVVSWDAYVPCHSDGTLIHRYKGMEQIFEGAPW